MTATPNTRDAAVAIPPGRRFYVRRAVWQPAAKKVPEHACLVTQSRLLGKCATEVVKNSWKALVARRFTVVLFL